MKNKGICALPRECEHAIQWCFIRILWSRIVLGCDILPAMIVRVSISGVEVKSVGDVWAGFKMAYLRRKAHGVFDPLWKDGFMPRNKAYRWLSNAFGIEEAHFSTMNEAELRRTIDLCRAKYEEFSAK